MSAAGKVKAPAPPKPLAKKPLPVKSTGDVAEGVKAEAGAELPLARDWPTICRTLNGSANQWHKSGEDPRIAVQRARRGFRELNLFWPRVLTVSPMVFDDLCNDLSVIAYFAGCQLPSNQDKLGIYHAKRCLARFLGVYRIDISNDEQGASVSK